MKYETILTKKQLECWLEKLRTADIYAFDTETTSKDAMNCKLVGVSFAIAGEAAYIPLAHDYEGVPKQLDLGYVLQKLKPILEETPSRLIGQNIKYDMNVLCWYGIDLKCAGDTMIISYCLDSTAKHGMDDLAMEFLNRKTIKFEDVAGKGKKQLTFNQIPIEQATPDAAEDAEITLELYNTMMYDLIGDRYELYRKIELPLIKVLARMEQIGVVIDRKSLGMQSKELQEYLLGLEKEIYCKSGTEFNINSPKQLAKLLYEDLGLPILDRTPTGNPATGEETLKKLSDKHELPQLILDYRGLFKLLNTYIDKLPKIVNKKTGRIHTSYNQAVTSTGRLSSSNPNLQNIPIRSEQGNKIRHAFIAPEGWSIIAADYSQVELRILAHISEDKTLIEDFKSGADIQKRTASQVFDVPLDQVSDFQRYSAKSINFGLAYGMSAHGLAKNLKIEKHVAQQYIDMYFNQYPGVKDYMEKYKQLAHDQGYVETIFGRRMYLPDINSKSKKKQLFAERNAINAPIQGTSADIIKMAMIHLNYGFMDYSTIRMTMQVHDELIFESCSVTFHSEVIKEVMENVVKLAVPLIVDVGTGKSWGEAH